MGDKRAVRRQPSPEQVPERLRRLWRTEAAGRLGRPAELDIDLVVKTAVQIADREGLEGVTLARVAKALGRTTMALYRHIGSKEELLSLMRDFAIGAPPEIAASPKQWRDGLRQWAHADRLVYERHPWLARLPISEPPTGPNSVAWMETALRVLHDVRLSWAQKIGVLMLVAGYVRQSALLAQDLEKGRTSARLSKSQAERQYGRWLAALIDPASFPEMAALLASGVFESGSSAADDSASDPEFAFGLDVILDGVAAALPRRDRRS